MKVRIELTDDSVSIRRELSLMDCLKLVAEKTEWAVTHNAKIREVIIIQD